LDAEVFHVWEFIEEELAERGWTIEDLAARMGPSHPTEVHLLALELLRDYREPDVKIEGSMANSLSHAFGTSPDLFVNLHANWLSSRRNP
jgi:plasmid maintenance system antidote protein VapI